MPGATSRRKFHRLLLTAIWLCIVAWRPFVLGFYHDDWSIIADAARRGAPFSAARFNAIFSVFAPRPLFAVVLTTASSLFDANPFLWQTAGALLSLAVAFAIRHFVDAISERSGIENGNAGLIAGACWLVLPTTLGSTAWPVGLPALAGVLAFLASGTVLLRTPRFEPGNYWPAVILYAVSLFTYETFYFQFAPVIVLAWALRKPRISQKQLVLCILCFSGVQAAAIVWNRIASHLPLAVSKSFHPDWPRIFVGSFVRLPHQLLVAFQEVRYPMIVVVLLLLALLFIAPRKSGMVTGLIAVFAVLISVAVYAVAGYGLTAVGLLSRTFLGVNVWFCIGFGTAVAMQNWSLQRRKLALALPIAFLTLCGVATIYRTGEWARSWREQRAIIASAPLDALSRLPSDALVLADVPSEVGGVTIFEAPWDISGALAFSQRRFTVKREWKSSWNGTTLHQSWGDSSGTDFLDLPARELWIWRWPANTLTRVESTGSLN